MAKGKGQRANGKGQRAKGKGQRAKGKGQRAWGKGNEDKGQEGQGSKLLPRRRLTVRESQDAALLRLACLPSVLCPLPFAFLVPVRSSHRADIHSPTAQITRATVPHGLGSSSRLPARRGGSTSSASKFRRGRGGSGGRGSQSDVVPGAGRASSRPLSSTTTSPATSSSWKPSDSRAGSSGGAWNGRTRRPRRATPAGHVKGSTTRLSGRPAAWSGPFSQYQPPRSRIMWFRMKFGRLRGAMRSGCAEGFHKRTRGTLLWYDSAWGSIVKRFQ